MPTLAYYLKLLELPNLELENLVEMEIETNPLIEKEESEELQTKELSEQKREADEFNISDLFAGDSSISYEYSEEEFDPLENVPAQNDKLHDHLLRQAQRKFKGRDLEIAELIISNIEEDGHLAVPLEEFVQEGYEIEELQRVRKEIQFFDPVGCAWQDIKESLLAQLEKLGYGSGSVEYILVRDYLTNFKDSSFKEAVKKLDISEDRLAEAKKVIMKLNPRPGLTYSTSDMQYVMPDFVICWQDDRLVARCNDDNIPRIRIKSEYIEKLRCSNSIPPDELEFIKKKLQSAQNLKFAIEQRRKTLNRIINFLLEYQKEYFIYGPGYLKPITMVEFAKHLGVNTSTISRAVANKYLESPAGIYKLKFFFTAPVAKTARRHILEKIKEIIANEEKNAPLSDAQISKKLARAGIIISRRTVTKYREQLGIPPHQLRRKDQVV